MKTLINNMIEAGHLSRDDELRFDVVNAIFDHFYQQVAINEPRNLIPPMRAEGLQQDVWFTAMGDNDKTCRRQQYDDMYTYAIELLKYVGAGTLTSQTPTSGYSVGLTLAEVIDDILTYRAYDDDYLGDASDDQDQPSPENYCIVLSHVLAKIITDNVQVHGALVLYYHGQFVRLGLIDPPELVCQPL